MRRRDVRQKFQQSKALFAQKRYPEALILLDELNTLFPNERHIMYARAMCLAELQRPLEAMQICEQAVAMHNDQKSRELLDRLRREHGPLEENPTDLASLTGQTAAGPTPNALPGLPSIPSVPDVPDFPALQPQSSNKRFYIILGSVAGVLLILLIGFPLLASLRKSNESSGIEQAVVSEASGIEEDARPSPPAELESPATAETPDTPAASAPKPLQWYYNYEEGKRVASDYDRPLCIFFYDGGEKSSAVEESIFQDPAVSQALSQFICIRVLYDANNQAAINYGVEEVPVVILQDMYADTVYNAWGDEIVAEDLLARINQIQLVPAATQIAERIERGAATAFITLILLGLLAAPWPLYFTLMFTGKLPQNGFFKDIFIVGLVAIGTDVISGSCIGVVLAIWILNSVFDMGLIDFLIYVALKTIMAFLLVAAVVSIFGFAFLDQIPV